MSTLVETRPPEGDVGQITTPIEIRNLLDVARAQAPGGSNGEIPSLAIPDILADAGATHLSLPADMIESLGLLLLEEVRVSTASGLMTTRLFAGALITIGGRRGAVDCLELPQGCRPLLGAIPMENLGIELDLRNRRLRFLPDSGPDTYLTA